jgi:hypothetical protein
MDYLKVSSLRNKCPLLTALYRRSVAEPASWQSSNRLPWIASPPPLRLLRLALGHSARDVGTLPIKAGCSSRDLIRVGRWSALRRSSSPSLGMAGLSPNSVQLASFGRRGNLASWRWCQRSAHSLRLPTGFVTETRDNMVATKGLGNKAAKQIAAQWSDNNAEKFHKLELAIITRLFHCPS